MSKNFSQEAFEAESKKVWGDRVEHSKTVFTSLRDKVTFTLDGMEFTQTAWRHINGVRPQGLFAASRTTSLESLKARSQAIDGDKYNLSLVTEVKNVGQIIPVICNYCGETFLQSVRHRIEGRQCKCQKGKAPRKIAAKKKYLDIDTIYVSGKRMTKFEEANDPPPKFHDFMKKYINNPKREREYGPNSACTNQND